jgi:hypothetical protein
MGPTNLEQVSKRDLDASVFDFNRGRIGMPSAEMLKQRTLHGMRCFTFQPVALLQCTNEGNSLPDLLVSENTPPGHH